MAITTHNVINAKITLHTDDEPGNLIGDSELMGPITEEKELRRVDVGASFATLDIVIQRGPRVEYQWEALCSWRGR